MSDDYRVQLSTTVNGNLLNLRAQSGEDLKELVEDLAVNVDAVVSAFVQVKQAVIAKDILTGDAGGSKPRGNSGNSGGSSNGGVPECSHGPMKDLRSKGYKSDFYCASNDRNNQCKPVKL